MTYCCIWFVGKRGRPCAVAPDVSSHHARPIRLLYSTLLYFPLLGFAHPVFADDLKFSIDDLRSALSDSSQSAVVDSVEKFAAAHSGVAAADSAGRSSSIIGHHHGMRDEDLSSLVTYVRQLDAETPQLISASGSSFHGSVYKDAAFSALRDYAQQIGIKEATRPSIEESDSAHPARADDADILALHQYARQIGADRPDAADAPNVKIAEADNAFDALRDFLQRGAPPDPNTAPNSAPGSPPKAKSRATPKRAKPAAPYVAPVLVGHLVGSKTCLGCHAAQSAAFSSTLMGRLAKTQPGKFECETCHGPGSEHLKGIGCASCHGEGGITKRPGTPSLVGLDPEYLVPAMKAYVNGQRKHELMRSVLVGVGDAELRSIARYYASQVAERAPTPLVGNPAAGRGAIEVCAGCHGEHGISIVPAWPSLAGQDSQYLADAIRAYKHGARSKVIACAACHGEGGISREPGMPSLAGMNPEYLVPAMKAYINGDRKHRLMKALLVGLGDAELEKMADFYADQTPGRAHTPLVGDPSAGRSAAAVCTGCHGTEGASIDPAWPVLAGQDSQYLADAIKAYKEGSRDKTVACASCHGERGISKRSGMPSLAGLDPQYLVAAMKAYVSGERKHALMKALLANVSDAELNSMAVYYGRQAPARAQTGSTGDSAAGKTASAACAGCHGEQGVSANAQWPSLAGQDARYLAAATKAYKDGSRGDATMKALVASLDESTINNIAAYYAGLRPAQPTIPASMQNIPARADPVLLINGVVAGLDSRTIADVASYFASLGPERSKHGDHGGKREPVVIRNNLVASLDERSIANVASYYATQRPEQPEGGKGVSGGPPPVRVGGAAPADGSSVGGIISFRKNDPSRRVEDNNAICLNCHERGERAYWHGSVHEERAVACTDCHTIMKNVSAKHQLKTAWEPNTCFQCHKDRQAQVFRSSHMPVREGKIACSDCHNPHGSTTVGLLREASVNDNCYKCHAEKRGPFLFEHAPVRENCLNCHDPHGTINEFSLKMSRPRLCYECHTIGHGQGGVASQFSVSRSCQNCHTLIHGSNSPAGAVFQR